MAEDDGVPADGGASATFDRAKAQRAARDPKRPGELCRARPGSHAPQVDRNRCEGKADCAAVCPYDVFEVRRMDDVDFGALSFLGRLKSRAHGRLTAYAPGASRCRACGLCVVACPEKAVRLVALSEAT
jgi:4Fe-4S ferredoxin